MINIGPQLEHGFTRIANEILEELARTDMNGTQRRILDVIFRQTYGFQRKEHDLSLSFISKATGIHRMQIQRELTALIQRNIITITKAATFNKSRVLSFNKNYNSWLNSEQLANKLTVSESDNHTVSETANPTVSGLANQRKKDKETIKERDYKSIYDYYLSLNLVRHRAYTKDMYRAIKKAMDDNKYSVEYCKTLLDRHKQVIEITKNHDYPVRVRGIAEFFGQKVHNGSHLICSEYDEGGKYYEQYLNMEKPPTSDDPYAGWEVY